MRKLNIGVIDVVANRPNKSYYAKFMRANLAGIMAQVVAVWCQEEGHKVHLAYYAGSQNMVEELPDKLDVVFIGAFTTSAHIAYALSNQFRSNGAVTVLGGPHARAYPTDAQNYFDYVVGFTDKEIIKDILADRSPYRPQGIYLTADKQPESLPNVRQRWPYIERLLREAPTVKIVSMIASRGCPYNCSFCVDSVVTYQPLDQDTLKEDLRFLLTKFKRPRVGWHDPNFGIRFNEVMTAIEEAVPPDSIDFIAESSLSLLSETNVKRLKKNGFKAFLPGIESWFDLGHKSKTGKKSGLEKVQMVSEQVNMIQRHLPYLQANFILGLDTDTGDLPFELTKEFIDRSPGAFPAYSMLTAFGRSAPLNLEYQKEDRILPFPFLFLNNTGAMNVRPKHYTWPEFYDKMIDLHKYSFSSRAIYRRYKANRGRIPKWMNVLRAISSEGWGKIRYFKKIRRKLDEDSAFRAFFKQESHRLPSYFEDQIKESMGPLWHWLPEGGLYHNPHLYLKSERKGITA